MDLMDALRKSLATEVANPKGKKAWKASAGQKEMLLPVEGKKPAEGGEDRAINRSSESRVEGSSSL